MLCQHCQQVPAIPLPVLQGDGDSCPVPQQYSVLQSSNSMITISVKQNRSPLTEMSHQRPIGTRPSCYELQKSSCPAEETLKAADCASGKGMPFAKHGIAWTVAMPWSSLLRTNADNVVYSEV